MNQIERIVGLNTSDFYQGFTEEVNNINLRIKLKKNEYTEFFSVLKTVLEQKKKELFNKANVIQKEIPDGFFELQKICNGIVEKNNEFSKHLITEQANAKNALRCHEVHKLINEFNFNENSNRLAALKLAYDEAQKNYADKIAEIKTKQNERIALIAQTRDESIIAEKINKLMKNIGVTSFFLQLINDVQGQRGQYQIKGHNGKIRPLAQLSKGEKNIIAFLYFIFSLERVGQNSKPKIIILDDPMTSNDDTMQYLMTSQINKLIQKIENSGDYFLLLTHNLHFYLNVRPSYNEKEEDGILKRNRRVKEGECKEKSFYEKNACFILYKDGFQTTINTIKTYEEDFKTSYDALWDDLKFLYTNNKPVSMLNNCRRIIETYTKFNGVKQHKFYDGSEFMQKYFNVNSHSIDDYENELNGKTRDEIMNMFRELFMLNSSGEHFNNYWKDNFTQ